MRPRAVALPKRSVGTVLSGTVNEALISMRVSLTVGSRWRTRPASHVLAGDGAVAAWASRSAGAVSESPTAAELRRKLRRSMASMAARS
jgi:hypothetical protein